MEASTTRATDRADGAVPGELKAYTPVAVGFHWLVAALLIGQIAFGWFLTTVPRGSPMRGFYVNLHKSTGLVILAVILLRVSWRLWHAPPRLPSFMPAWERAAARGNHAALYALMLVMPLSGYIASNFSRYGIKFFNAVKLPPWGIDDHRVYAFFNSVHVVTAYVFAAIIAVHVLAALRHAVRRDRIFSRMLK
ncbi:MAG: cytochrome b [Steroidobacteraceae bacterium]